MRAAEHSAEVRRQRKLLREKMRDGTVDPYKLLAGEIDALEPFIAGWKLTALLQRVPGVGEVREHAILVAFGAPPNIKISALSPARRQELAELVRRAVDFAV